MGAKPKSLDDVVAYIDQNMTTIDTPVLHDYLDKCGWSYIGVIGKLEKRGWTLNYAARTMTKEVTA